MVNKKEINLKPSDVQKIIRDMKNLMASAFNITQKDDLSNLKYSGEDLKISDLLVCNFTIKESIKDKEWERHDNLLNLMILWTYQLGFQNGKLVAANEYEKQFDDVIKKNTQGIKDNHFTEKGQINAETQIELCQKLSVKYRDEFYKKIDKRLANLSKSQIKKLDMLLEGNIQYKFAKYLHEKANNYGLSFDGILKVVQSIPENLIEDFFYTMSRIAEKSGFSALNYSNMFNENEQ